MAAAGAFVVEGAGVGAEAWPADGGTLAAVVDALAAACLLATYGSALAAPGLSPAVGALAGDFAATFPASPSGQMAERRRTRCPG